MNYDIRIIKLTSGEELIVKVIKDEMMQLTVMHPLSVAPSQQGVGLIPSFFTSDEDSEVLINKSNITMYAAPREEVKNKYIEMISGITLPDKKIIMG